MKGDRVEVVVDAGDSSRVYDVRATRAGRRVEVTTGRGIVEVTEVTRGGTPVRTARFMTGRVIALVEIIPPTRGAIQTGSCPFSAALIASNRESCPFEWPLGSVE